MHRMKNTIIMQTAMLLFVMSHVPDINALKYNGLYDLQRELLANYSPTIRPLTNQGKAITVLVDFRLNSILSFDERAGTLKTICYLAFVWIDEKIRWDFSVHNIENIYFPRSSVWVPRMTLQNSATEYMNINTGDTQDKRVVYHPTGSASFALVGLATTKCDAVMLYFPFDRHSCELKFISSEPIHQVMMVIHEFPLKVPSYESKEWKVLNIKKKHSIFHVARNHSMVSFTIQFERRPAFYILNILSPIPCLGLTNVLVFALPISSGERVSFSITILLTLVFFLNMIADRLPPTSEPISLFNVMVMVQLQNSVFIVICTTLSMMAHEKAQKSTDVPSMLCKIVVFLQKTNRISMSSDQEDGTVIPANVDELITFQKTSNSSSKITWGAVSDCTERFFSRLFSCIFIVEWIIYLMLMVFGTGHE